MKKLLTLFAGTLFALNICSNPSTTIATWKNDAKGAYSFIHDDYGDPGVSGINNYADAIARARGIKFTIGAITSACENNPQMWTDAIDMINYGHEIINHSHNHYCAVGAGTWCTTGLWAEPATEDFATELTYSNNSIITNTGTTPRFFIYPYDLFNTAANNHLKSLDYIGSRTGTYDGDNAANFAPDADGFFRTAFYVKTEDNNGDITAIELNNWADHASANNVWVNREMHNVGPTGWGRIGVSDYTNHLDHLQSEVAANNLWVGTISEVLTYQIQKINYTPTTSYDAGTTEITVSWNTPTFDVAAYLSPLTKKSPVTILVDLNGLSATGKVVKQGVNIISNVTVTNGIMKFDAYPSEGTIIIGPNVCNDFCFVSGPSDLIVTEGDNASFSINITATPTVTYAWYLNDVLISGETGSSLNLTNVQTTQAGTYKVVASKTGKIDIVDSGTLTVNNQTPFNNTIATIPGIIQIENFDEGGQGVAYNETSGTNQGNSFVRSDPVDLENEGSGITLGWTVTGEWLEYTVNVAQHAVYDLDVRHASLSTNGAITLSINGTDVSNSLVFSPTGSWTTWQTTTFGNITLTQGQHIIRVTMDADDGNLDYLEFKVNQIITGVSGPTDDIKVAVYPNPFTSSFTINSNGKKIENISVSTLEGKKVIAINSSTGNLNLGDNLSPGVYLIEFSVQGTIHRKKIVKE
ncbi:MAG: hypothetical protein ACJA0Q_001286 [Saprospiraceae bacterium]|jgi:hypothetical protein